MLEVSRPLRPENWIVDVIGVSLCGGGWRWLPVAGGVVRVKQRCRWGRVGPTGTDGCVRRA